MRALLQGTRRARARRLVAHVERPVQRLAPPIEVGWIARGRAPRTGRARACLPPDVLGGMARDRRLPPCGLGASLVCEHAIVAPLDTRAARETPLVGPGRGCAADAELGVVVAPRRRPLAAVFVDPHLPPQAPFAAKLRLQPWEQASGAGTSEYTVSSARLKLQPDLVTRSLSSTTSSTRSTEMESQSVDTTTSSELSAHPPGHALAQRPVQSLPPSAYARGVGTHTAGPIGSFGERMVHVSPRSVSRSCANPRVPSAHATSSRTSRPGPEPGSSMPRTIRRGGMGVSLRPVLYPPNVCGSHAPVSDER